ncbi:MAG: alpha/beta hydrolase, partial [Planctomycetota bacterium]
MKYQRIAAKISLYIVAAAALVWLTVLLLHGFQSRKKQDLSLYHTVKLKSEFHARDARGDYTFVDYLETEQRVFEELDAKIVQPLQKTNLVLLNRYNPQSPCRPDVIGSHYNRTIEHTPEIITGGALLLHGLTDSPYSMRHLAKVFHTKGYYTLSLRVPGHGTAPSGLTTAHWEDWLAAVELAAQHVRQSAGTDKPFIIAGYSNGGALSVLYTLNALNDEQLPNPDKVFLFSPAISVSKLAAFAHQLQALSFIDYFEKSNWQTIAPEHDPFKYNSFPLMAASQSHELSKAIQKSLAKNIRTAQWKTLCPIITFQSVIDSTVSVPAITQLYAKLPDGDHELILFDVNRASVLDDFLKTNPQQILDTLDKTAELPYSLTLISNETPESLQVVSRTRIRGNDTFDEPTHLNLQWPSQIYSMSHIAFLFPPNDPLYGTAPDESVNCIRLGTLEMRGERGLLQISEANLMRLRCNPFYPWMEEKITAAIPTASE